MLTVELREQAPFRPFCCKRCKLIDLGRWFDGSYVISGSPQENAVQPDAPEDHDPPDREQAL